MSVLGPPTEWIDTPSGMLFVKRIQLHHQRGRMSDGDPGALMMNIARFHTCHAAP